MKTCIYGAGAIGGWLGVKLARAGSDVSVVARGATLEALQTNGLRLLELLCDLRGLLECSLNLLALLG